MGKPMKERYYFPVRPLPGMRRLGWALVDNPRRLRVQTIDSFCQELVRRMPWSARFGGLPWPIEDASSHYLEAADATLQLVEERQQPVFANACARVLRLVDANRDRACVLLAELLDQRDRWMNVLGHHSREQFESWWQATVSDTLHECHRLLDDHQRRILVTIANFAAQQVQVTENNAPQKTRDLLVPWQDSNDFPVPDWQQLDHWKGLAHLLVKPDSQIRSPRGINKNLGFPSGDTEYKQRLQGLLEDLGRRCRATACLATNKLPPGTAHRRW